jgi:hypothetical protein
MPEHYVPVNEASTYVNTKHCVPDLNMPVGIPFPLLRKWVDSVNSIQT